MQQSLSMDRGNICARKGDMKIAVARIMLMIASPMMSRFFRIGELLDWD